MGIVLSEPTFDRFDAAARKVEDLPVPGPRDAGRRRQRGSARFLSALLLEDLPNGKFADAVELLPQSDANTPVDPDDAGSAETKAIRVVTLFGDVTGGTWTLSDDSEETAALEPDADADAVETAIVNLSGVTDGQVRVFSPIQKDGTHTGKWFIQFKQGYRLGSLTADVTNLTTDLGVAVDVQKSLFLPKVRGTVQEPLRVTSRVPLPEITPLRLGLQVAGELRRGFGWEVGPAECRHWEGVST